MTQKFATAREITKARKSNEYKALMAHVPGLDDAGALESLGLTLKPEAEAAPVPANDPVAALIATGLFSAEAARAAVERSAKIEADTLGEVAPAPAPEPAKPLTSKERGEALVSDSGLSFTRGRVYLTGDTIEAAARVKKTGSPEIIRSSGVGHTKAVLLYREESGDIAAQNLTETA